MPKTQTQTYEVGALIRRQFRVLLAQARQNCRQHGHRYSHDEVRGLLSSAFVVTAPPYIHQGIREAVLRYSRDAERYAR